MLGLLQGENGLQLIEKHALKTIKRIPHDIVNAFDVLFVDENDSVRFFSNPPHRIFPRTMAIIGRKVQFCHPPESVHVVEKIVNSFKIGSYWTDKIGICINFSKRPINGWEFLLRC